MRRSNLPLLALLASTLLAASTARAQPSQRDVAYGPDGRHRLDVHRPEGDGPFPVVVFIHGGGFTGGSKDRVPERLARGCRQEGIAVVSVEYRMAQEHPFPAAFEDAARAIQFLRAEAGRLDLDPDRIAVAGGSAGAGLSLWLAFADDRADPAAEDPIARQSTRVVAASVSAAQVSYDPRFWKEHGLGGGLRHPSFPTIYRLPADWTPDDAFEADKVALAEACSPIEHLTADDAPVLFIYNVPDRPPRPDDSIGALVHHPRHGQVCKERMDELGIECHVRTRGGRAVPDEVEFLSARLAAAGPTLAFGLEGSWGNIGAGMSHSEQLLLTVDVGGGLRLVHEVKGEGGRVVEARGRLTDAERARLVELLELLEGADEEIVLPGSRVLGRSREGPQAVSEETLDVRWAGRTTHLRAPGRTLGGAAGMLAPPAPPAPSLADWFETLEAVARRLGAEGH